MRQYRTFFNDGNKTAALIIGINYVGTNNELNGCINDAKNIKKYLVEDKKVKENNILLLEDNGIKPTREKILEGFDWLVEKSKQGYTKLWFSYSGHGYYIKDTNGDEKDGRDEVLCPIDYATNGFVTDDEIRARLVEKLGANIRLFALIDACNSGTMLDLKYMYDERRRRFSYASRVKNPKASVIMISGCKDTQTSADAYIDGEYTGALTYTFLSNAKKNVNFLELIFLVNKYLDRNSYTQDPRLSFSRKRLFRSRF